MSNESQTLPPSQRGLGNLRWGQQVDLTSALEETKIYDPVSNTGGLIDLNGAINQLMPDYLQKIAEKFTATNRLESILGYGPTVGAIELPEAVSHFINRKFDPAIPVRPSDVIATSGVSSLLDIIAFNICDPGEGMMIAVPCFSLYEHHLCSRAGITLIPVPISFPTNTGSHLIESFEQGYEEAVKKGVRVKAVLICNPSNPVGRFYSKQALKAIAGFCGERGLHLVADEIFAMSCFDNDEEGQLDTFTSVLSIPDDVERNVRKENIHALYGASKDFGMGGLRLGFLVSRNEVLKETCKKINLDMWTHTFSATFFKSFISNDTIVDEYLHEYQTRLKNRYLSTSAALKRHGIPYLPANGALFVWIDLSKWLKYFKGVCATEEVGSREEEELCRYLIRNGVYMSMGTLSMSPVPGRFRFVYSVGKEDMPVLAVGRIGKALKELEVKRRVVADCVFEKGWQELGSGKIIHD